MKKKVTFSLVLTLVLTAIISVSAFAWEPTLYASINTNGGRDMSVNPGTTVTHNFNWGGNYVTFSGSFYAKLGYSRTYNNVVYTSDSMPVTYNSGDGATQATLNIRTSRESVSDYLNVYVLN